MAMFFLDTRNEDPVVLCYQYNPGLVLDPFFLRFWKAMEFHTILACISTPKTYHFYGWDCHHPAMAVYEFMTWFYYH